MKLILTADWHLRPDAPISRTDDYVKAQVNKLQFLIELKRKYEAEILNAGDIVHRARERKEPVSFVNWLMDNLPYMYGVLGNHDLLYHSLDNLHHTTMGAIIKAGMYKHLTEPYELRKGIWLHPFNWGEEIEDIEPDGQIHIAIYHGMVTEKEDPFLEGHIGKDLLRKNKGYDLILTGDNHKTFIVKVRDRYLVNPGSLKRDSGNQIEHKPCVFVYDTDDKSLEQVFLPIEEDVLDISHLGFSKEKNERLDKLVEEMKKNMEGKDFGIDFESNLREYCKDNKVDLSIEDVLSKWMEV